MPDNDPESIEEAIEQQAISGVKSMTEGSRSIQNLSIDEMIKADQYAKSKAAQSKPHFGLRMTRLRPPGCG